MFQQSVLNVHLARQDQKKLDELYAKFQKNFGDPEIQENYRSSKESSLQGEFLERLFVRILGYIASPDKNFNLIREVKNETNSKEADGAILVENEILAVIELKDLKTPDLDKIDSQAFDYHSDHAKNKYIITSNYQKLRFYIDKKGNKIEFDLFNLSPETFKILYLCLSWDSIRQNLPLKILGDSITTEEDITKKLYTDYSTFKTALWQNLCEKNPQFDRLTLFKKTQKLLDRFLFIFFAEDRGLLRPNEIERIVSEWKKLQELRVAQLLYDRFKQYFGYLNTGDTELDIFSYNGGLFLADEILDTVQIDDELLAAHTIKLAGYDFASDVDVNILGHIFEHSLSEIEEITAQLSRREEGGKGERGKGRKGRRTNQRKRASGRRTVSFTHRNTLPPTLSNRP